MSSAAPTETRKRRDRKLPKKFGLKIDSDLEPEPPASAGGDYLDLDAQPLRTQVPPPTLVERARVPESSQPPPIREVEARDAAPARAAPRAAPSKQKVYRKRSINVAPKTETKWDEVNRQVEDKIPERIKLKQADMFEAMINILHDARAEYNLSRVRRRGQWGTAQVDAFRTHLRESIEEGIVKNYLKRRGVDFDELRFDESQGA